jgi:hypothetical protein
MIVPETRKHSRARVQLQPRLTKPMLIRAQLQQLEMTQHLLLL